MVFIVIEMKHQIENKKPETFIVVEWWWTGGTKIQYHIDFPSPFNSDQIAFSRPLNCAPQQNVILQRVPYFCYRTDSLLLRRNGLYGEIIISI